MKHNQKIIYKTDFYVSLYEHHLLPPICENATFFDTPLVNNRIKNNVIPSSEIIILETVPNYIQLNLSYDLEVKKSIHKPGFAINLRQGFIDVDDYLKKQCSKNFRKVNNRSVQRLESSFNIQYKMFYGSICKPECDLLMERLKSMIKSRFTQRKGRNSALLNWDYYMDLAFKGINNKTASIFVIYDNDLPIEISLNFHFNNLMISLISSYDLDYSKFSLGNIEIYKQIEWCINNKIKIFDMCYGDFEYKRRWANFNYFFQTFYISNKKSVLSKLYIFLHEQKTKLIYFLVEKKINNIIHDTISKFKKTEPLPVELEYEVFDPEGHEHDSNNLDINDKDSYYLRKPVYDHIYTSQEHINNVKIYKSKTDPNSYIIKGDKSESGVKFL